MQPYSSTPYSSLEIPGFQEESWTASAATDATIAVEDVGLPLSASVVAAAVLTMTLDIPETLSASAAALARINTALVHPLELCASTHAGARFQQGELISLTAEAVADAEFESDGVLLASAVAGVGWSDNALYLNDCDDIEYLARHAMTVAAAAGASFSLEYDEPQDLSPATQANATFIGWLS